MDAPRPDATVVAAGAVLFLVAVRAELRVVRGDVLVALDEVGRVLRVVHPARRVEHAARERGLQETALTRAAFDVAGIAAALGVAARDGVGMLMASEAAAHPRQLIARRELELVDVAVALLAVDVPRRVLLVVEHHVRVRDVELRDAVAVTGLVADVTEGALAGVVVARLDVVQVRVVGAVAAVAERRLRREHVVHGLARQRSGVAALALELLRDDVELVVEADGQLLRGVHRGRGAGVLLECARRKPPERDARVARERREPGRERSPRRRSGVRRADGRLRRRRIRARVRLRVGDRWRLPAGAFALRECRPDRAEQRDDENEQGAEASAPRLLRRFVFVGCRIHRVRSCLGRS